MDKYFCVSGYARTSCVSRQLWWVFNWFNLHMIMQNSLNNSLRTICQVKKGRRHLEYHLVLSNGFFLDKEWLEGAGEGRGSSAVLLNKLPPAPCTSAVAASAVESQTCGTLEIQNSSLSNLVPIFDKRYLKNFLSISYSFPACQERCLGKKIFSIRYDEKEAKTQSNHHLLPWATPLQCNWPHRSRLMFQMALWKMFILKTISKTSCFIKTIQWKPELQEAVELATSF